MKCVVTLAVVFWAVALFAQAPQPAPGTTQPVTTPSATPGQPDPCSKEVTVYIDLSGTMTTQDPTQSNPNRVPLNHIAEALRNFVAAPDFLRPTDKVSIKFFGTIVQTQADGREEVLNLLARLGSPDQWRSVVSGVRETDFKRFTNFDKAFGDVRDRLNNSEAARQIVFVASDFVQDQFNQPNVDNVAPRVAAFRAALGNIRPFLVTNDNRGGRIQLVGIYSPDPPLPFDGRVAEQVRTDLAAAGMRLYQYNEDATEAARTLRNYFIGPIKARPAEEGGVRIGGDNRVGFIVSNPNCDPVTVVALEIAGTAVAPRRFEVRETSVVNGDRELRLDADALGALWNQDVTVTPVLREGSTARTEASPRFWLGDWIRVTRIEPYLYPFANRATGSTLVRALVNRSVRMTAGLSITGIEPGGRARSFTINSGSAEELMTFAFSLNEAQRQRLSAPNLTVQLEGNGLRIHVDSQPAAAMVELPIAASVQSRTGDILAWFQMAMWATLTLLAALLFWRAVFSRSDASLKDQATASFRRTLWLIIPAISNYFVDTRFGYFFGADEWIWTAVLARAVLASLTIFFVLRTALVVFAWKLAFERRLKPSRVAVFRRRVANALVWSTSLLVLGLLFYSFYGPPSNPDLASRILSGVLR